MKSHDSISLEANGDAGRNIESSENYTDLEVTSLKGEVRHEFGRADEFLTSLELDLACVSEKLLNLNILMMHLSAKESDFEPFSLEKEDASIDAIENALEFGLLSGIFESEIKELDDYIASLQREIFDAHEIMCSYEELEEKLHDSEESIKQLREQLKEMKIQSDNFRKITTAFATKEFYQEQLHPPEDGDFLSPNTKITAQISEQQRHILQMLEKSLATELDLDKKLAESKQTEDELKLKLQNSIQDIFSAEEQTMVIFERFLEADSTSEVLKGAMKELMGQLQSCQLIIHSVLEREEELQLKLWDVTEASNLKEGDLMKLKDEVTKAENRAASAEDKCKLLEEANDKLNVELTDKASAAEKVGSLERQLYEAGIQVQLAMVAVDASQEKQSMLSTTINDMGIVIENLKSKVSKAETRADHAEEQSIVLSEINEELHKENDYLRSRLETLEASRQRTEEAKAATAKDIGLRTKMIADLVLQLGIERERLRNQIYSLVKENRFLVEKLQETSKQPPADKSRGVAVDEKMLNEEGETFAAKELGNVQEKPLEDGTACEPEDIETKLETMRTIDARHLGFNFKLLAISGVMVAVVAICFLQQGTSPT